MSDEEGTSSQIKGKCGYCGYLIRSANQLLEHTCFKHFNKDNLTVDIDNNFVITIAAGSLSQNVRKEEHEWTEDWDELLIKAVSERPPIYNFSLSVKERSPLKIADLWKEISNSLGVPSKKLQSRWTYLRQNYSKAKQIERAYVRSGSAATSTKAKSEFALFQKMTFLDDVAKPTKTISNLSSHSESEEEDFQENAVEKEKKLVKRINENMNSRSVFREGIYENLLEAFTSQTPETEEQEAETMLLCLEPALRKLNPARRVKVQQEIVKALNTELKSIT